MLPKTEILHEKITLPISKKKVDVRAITTKEERILIMLNESSDRTDAESRLNVVDGVKDFISGCVSEKIDIDKLSTLDINVIFLKMMELSRGNIVRHMYKCNNVISDENGDRICNAIIPVTVNLKNIKYKNKENIKNNNVKLSDTLSVTMTYPTMEIFKKAKEISTDDFSLNVATVALSIKSIFNEDESYTEFTSKEIIEWFMDLPLEYSEKLIDYVSNEPSMFMEYDIVCPECGHKTHIVLEDISDFFTSTIQEKAS